MAVQEMTSTALEIFLATRTPEAREQVVLQSVPLVRYLLSRLGITPELGSEYEDLLHQGLIGLIEAVDRFDPSYGVRFSTYAAVRIRGKVLDYLRAVDWMTRTARQRVRAVRKAIEVLWLEHHREPSDEEIAAYLNTDVGTVQRGLVDSNRFLLSLDAASERDEDEETSLHDRLGDEKQPDPQQLSLEDDLRNDLAVAIRCLPEREQLVLSLYYHDELNFKEIGKVLGISESRVCQLHARALLNLKVVMKNE
ncbi:MAG: FliA/WhiG family RNA polymerase sigma factor [Chloroflexota bacterium]|jgi:RNA polymerase sigma factor for flagellar operon FliA